MVFLYYVSKKNKQNYLKRLETDVEFAILFIASEIIGAMEIISIFLLPIVFFELSIVSVVIYFLIWDFSILFIAWPLKTAWVI